MRRMSSSDGDDPTKNEPSPGATLAGGFVPPKPGLPPPQRQPPVAFDPQRAMQHVSVPEARLLESESSPIEQIAEVVGEVPGRFLGFLKLSAKRAFRIGIEPTEVLPDERQMLAAANPPVTEANLQAFL